MVSDLIPIKLPPGFFRNGTEYESKGRWYDGDQVRWHNGVIKPIGGWRRVLSGGATLTGKARAMLAWRGNSGFRYNAIGTNEKLYISSGGSYSDATPAAFVTGRADAVEGPGYGAGPYGDDSYGTQRSAGTLVLDASVWMLDTWGQNLLACAASDGRIFEWNPSIGGLPLVVTNAPIDCIGVHVTDQNHAMALGPAGFRRRVKWCSQGDNTIWAPSGLNTAGSIDLKSEGNIVVAELVGTDTIIWTTTDVHAADYLGPPYVYRNRRIDGDNCGAISIGGVIVVGGTAYWMSPAKQFHTYNGQVRTIPCEVWDYVFGDFNYLQRSKVQAFATSDFNEVGWNYCSADSTECDRRVLYNIALDKFYFDTIGRTVWMDKGVYVNPLAVDGDGVLWEHEVGMLADGASRVGQVYIMSGPAEIGSGDRIIYSNLMVPDVTSGAWSLTLKTRTAPMGALVNTDGSPHTLTPNSEGYVPVRIGARQASQRYDLLQDVDARIGTNRFKIAAGGKR